MSNDISLPNFLIIGAAKSGTTTIYDYLVQHPDIYMSPEKEPCFFAFEGENLNFQDPDNPLQLKAVTKLDEYLRLFEPGKNKKARGEASVIYMHSEKATERIKHYIPNARMIAILRDPVERAYSNFMMLKRDQREPIDDFLTAFYKEPERVRMNWEFSYCYQTLGLYFKQLTRYYSSFNPSQIKIFLYEDLENDPIGLAKEIYSFIGADPSFTPSAEERKNMSGIPKNKWLFNLMSRPNPIRSILRGIFPKSVRTPISMSFKRHNLKKPTMPTDVRRKVLAYYREDTLQLQNLIGRDLSSWLNVENRS